MSNNLLMAGPKSAVPICKRMSPHTNDQAIAPHIRTAVIVLSV